MTATKVRAEIPTALIVRTIGSRCSKASPNDA